MISSGVFARGTRSISVATGVSDGVVRSATLKFSPDDGTLVESYDLYVAKGDADYGPDISMWPWTSKLATIASNDNSYEINDIDSSVGEWTYARFFLKNPNYVTRTDGLKILDKITSSGAQKILISGYKPLSIARFDYEIAFSEMPKDGFYCIFCARNSKSNTYTSFLHHKNNTTTWRMDYGATAEHMDNLGCVVNATNRFSTVGTGCSVVLGNWVNGTYSPVTTDYPSGFVQAGNDLTLFASYSSSATETTLGNPAKMTMFAFRATENGLIVHNLLPATTNNNVAGLYDVVDGKFYASTSSTPFSAGTIEGPDLVESSTAVLREPPEERVARDELKRPYEIVPSYDAAGRATSVRFDFEKSDVSITQRVTAVFGRNRVVVTNLPPGEAASFVYDIPLASSPTCLFEVEPLLPDGYSPLEYMETSASNDNNNRQGCFLDTGYTPRGTTSVKAKVACLSLKNDKSNWTLFCARNGQDAGTGNAVFSMFALNSLKFRFDYAFQRGTDTSANAFSVGSPFEIVCSVPGGFNVTQTDESSATYALGIGYANFTASGSMRLFASYTNSLSSVGNGQPMRVYDYRVRDIDGEQLTLLPAKNSAGVVGLWDFKSGTFRTSSGGVAFSAGEAESISAFLQTTEAYPVRCRGAAVFVR